MSRTLISLGANLGNVRETMSYAKRMLIDQFPDGDLRFSHLYRTPAIGGPQDQGDFLNAVVAIESDSSVWQVWETIKKIESDLGRRRFQRWEARRIDIDVLLHDDLRIWTPHFKIPHPRMCMRSFILQPAAEVASEWFDPVSSMTVGELLQHLHRPNSFVLLSSNVQLLEQFKRLIQSSPIDCPVHWLLVQSRDFQPSRIQSLEAKLVVAVVSTPDPETVQWEDYARDWAIAFGIQTDPTTPRALFSGPRYLLPGNDLPWAAHEVLAAFEAMQCPVEKVCAFD
ncbi:MAG: 2-amino-4-hydroxy-6-hydroxymethyldihydropteridine diphosphokinase [Planctomycetota bacterium]|jgi:2-amino-4-hydroxy-6-hydroxymethyldihydropteridine diphosphokinase|nr:2-amino-4-hydroxy-6-hydroxymethyldihydropteridine diphosphokinase [Planctomycetota bacterium]